MELICEGGVINPLKRKRSRKVIKNPEILSQFKEDNLVTDENCVTFFIGDVQATYATDWNYNPNQIAEIQKAIYHAINNLMQLDEEEVSDFNVIYTYDNQNSCYLYELHIVVTASAGEKLQNYYSD